MFLKEAACISLGLEGHIVGMRTADFQDIIAGEVDGPNEDPEKAAKIRTFLLPDRFVTKGSSTSPRHVKIFAAWISSEWVWALLDFSGLVRIHVKSKSRAWTEADLAVGSPVSCLVVVTPPVSEYLLGMEEPFQDVQWKPRLDTRKRLRYQVTP